LRHAKSIVTGDVMNAPHGTVVDRPARAIDSATANEERRIDAQNARRRRKRRAPVA
jgi:hypothetical protein